MLHYISENQAVPDAHARIGAKYAGLRLLGGLWIVPLVCTFIVMMMMLVMIMMMMLWVIMMIMMMMTMMAMVSILILMVMIMIVTQPDNLICPSSPFRMTADEKS